MRTQKHGLLLFMPLNVPMGLETMQAAYKRTIEERSRFDSYGDARRKLPEG